MLEVLETRRGTVEIWEDTGSSIPGLWRWEAWTPGGRLIETGSGASRAWAITEAYIALVRAQDGAPVYPA